MKAAGHEWGARYPSLNGRRVLITGGGSGIGEFIVEGFAEQGARVAFVDIDANGGEAVAARLSAGGLDVRFIRQDLKNVVASQAMIAGLIDEWGGIDILVNNAANDDRHSIDEVTPDYWDDRMAVNLRHVFFCAQAVAPSMKAAGKGAIVNLGSISWHLALPDLALYQTAKAAIEGMTRSMARDWGAHGIRANCVIPGAVKTPRQMALWHDDEEEAKMLAQQCLKTRVLPQDIAAMVMFLASDDARLCSGHTYFVDAGWR